MNISLNVLIKKISLIVLLFFTVVLSAQVQEKEYSNFKPIAITSFGTSPISIFDSESNVPNQNNLSYYCYLSLNIDNNLAPYVAYELKATFRVTPLKQDGSNDASFDKEFVVNYNPNQSNSGGANFNDLSYLKIENRFGIRVQLISFKALNTTNGSVVPTNAFVTMGFRSKRYYSVSEQLPNPIGSTNAAASSITINWVNLAGALEYELEWTWIDSYSNENITAHLPGDKIPLTERDFELNNTRIITSKNTFEIPLIYGKGYLIYRVRGISRNTEFVKYYGNWSSGTSPKSTIADWPHQSFISEHETGKNWQFQASYAEDGKKKEIVSYFDGSLRNRQTVTKINTDNTTIVGEVIYDAQGRAGIEILPTPNIDTNIHYFKNYNLNNKGKIYSYKDFDIDGDSCSSSISEMSNVSGSSRYYSYSGFGDFSSKVNQAYVPDAKLYPFSQIEYTPDNTGRIARKGGVGPDHQLGSNHEMKYFYTTPSASELYRLFGYSVGESSHYRKNIVIDPNAQVSVSYLDPQGRTIATALSGKSPSNLDPLLEEKIDSPVKFPSDLPDNFEGSIEDYIGSSANGHGNTTTDLLNKLNTTDADTPKDNNILQSTGVFSQSNDVLTLSKSIEVTNNGEAYKFEYSLNQESSFSPFYCPTGLYPFVYDVKFGLKDNCGNEQFDAPILKKAGTFSLSGSHIAASIPKFTSNLTLNTGSYSLNKEIKVNEKALNEYADHYIKKLTTAGSECYIDPADPKFGLSPNTQLIMDSCDLTCTSCLTSIGTKLNYVQGAFDNLYGKVVVTVSESDKKITTLLNTGATDAQEILIGQSDVDALSVRFSREWDLLKIECERVCNPNAIEFETVCQMNENLLVSDLRPNGQYGATDFETVDENGIKTPNLNFDKLSVFNTNGTLYYNGKTEGNNWKHPKIAVSPTQDKVDTYKDMYGNPSLIEVKIVNNTTNPKEYSPEVDPDFTPVLSPVKGPDGSDIWTVQPEQLLNVSDFIANWDDGWAQSLLLYHPEYSYLEYSREICKRTTGTDAAPVTSDAYDAFLMSSTYAEANSKQLVDFDSAGNSGKLQIYNNDPFFKQVQSSAPFEDATLYSMRVGSGSIMYQALNSSYIGANGINMTMYQVALQGVLCNSFSKCDLNNVVLSEAQKNEVWNAYKGLYIGLKNKIKHIFSNIYAMKRKSFNGCIGTASSSAITNVLSDNFTQKTLLNNYIQSNITTAGSLCESSSAALYQSKQKNYLPADFGYNSSLNPIDAADNVVKANHFEYYAQTGNCPLLFDFDMLLNGFFKDADPSLNPRVSLVNKPFNKQYLTKELMQKLMLPTGNKTVEELFASGLEPLTITTNVSGTTLNVNLNPKTGGAFITCPILVQLPATGGYTWSNYGASWDIKNLKQIYYDLGNSDALGGKFKFSVVAQIGAIGDSTISTEIILTGETCAPIGECGISPNAIGQVLDPNMATNDQGVGCNKKSKFERALMPLFNELKAKGTFNSSSPVDISNYTAYRNSYLEEFFGAYSGVTWERAAQNIYIKQDQNIIANFVLETAYGMEEEGATSSSPVLIDSYTFKNFDSITFGTIANNSTRSFQLITSGNTNFTTGTAILKGTLKLFNANFDCCPFVAILDADHDGVPDDLDNCPDTANTDQLDVNPKDGIGDACQGVPSCTPTPNINSCTNTADEIAFETGLKDLINKILSDQSFTGADANKGLNFDDPTMYRICSEYPEMNSFIINSHLTEHFQALKNKDNSIECTATSNIELFRFTWGKDVDDSIGITFYNQNNERQCAIRLEGDYMQNEEGIEDASVYFNKIDILSGNEISINHNSKLRKCTDFKSLYSSRLVIYVDGCYSISENFCDFLAPLQPNTDTVISCSLNAQEELKFENNLRDVFNEAISNNYVSDYNLKNSSSSTTISHFISDSNLISHFQSLRDYFVSIDPSNLYNNPVDLSRFKFWIGGLNSQFIMDIFNSESQRSAQFYLNIQDVRSISLINSIDFVDSTTNGVIVKYVDKNGVSKSVNATMNYYIALHPSGGRSSSYCTFFAEDYPLSSARLLSSRSASSIDISTFTVDTSGVTKITNANSRLSKTTSRLASIASTESCSTCIPQTVAPVACGDKKTAFIQAMNTIGIEGYSVPQSTLDNFCDNGYQYISDSYIRYLKELKVTELYDIRFRTLAEFGDTYLHYGFNGINAVIDQYKKYYEENIANNEVTPILSWNDWVETKFRPDNIGKVCPPAALSTTVSPSLPEETESTCEKLVKNITEAFSADNYTNLIQEKRKEFIASYIKKAMSEVVETLDMTNFDQEYQYTLYYYDQAGNLTQTVAPEGVKRFSPAEIKVKNPLIEAYKAADDPLKPYIDDNASLQPDHKFKTQYRYNSLNQLVWQSTPDGGITRFAYDKLGRIIASQNAKQLASSIAKMSYTTYDSLGRIIQAGEIDSFVNNANNPTASLSYSISPEGRLVRSPKPTGATTGIVDGFDSDLPKNQVTRTVYDEDPEVETAIKASSLFTSNTDSGYNPAYNNRNRVTGIFYHEKYTKPLVFNNAILYTYDVHGNVKEIVNYYTGLKNPNCSQTVINTVTGQTNDCEAHLKRIVYNYDLISGNVNTVKFQPNKPDQFIHRYNYDADNRIVNVETSTNEVLWEKDASYEYYAHGPLARVELGDKKVQGIDYAYTLQGWLKTVNGENLSSPENDLGHDGLLSGSTKTSDAFGYSLSYYDKDYKAISGDTGAESFKPLMVSRNAIGSTDKNLYNGNIKQMTTAIRKEGNQLLDIQKNNYTYDQLNRISGMTSQAFNAFTMSATKSYSSNYSYDRNGNLQKLNRTAPKTDGSIAQMDQLVYDYQAGTNKLALVKDKEVAQSGSFNNDLEDQLSQLAGLGINYDITNQKTHNYVYDEIGQLIEDKTEGLKIEWRVDGKVKRVVKNTGGNTITYTFEYDGLGNRIAKKEFSNFGVVSNPTSKTTLYARDAQGNELATYYLSDSSSERNLFLRDHNIYGSSRLGLEENNLLMYRFLNNVSTSRSASSLLKSDNSIGLRTSSLTGTPVFRDYALHFDATTPSAAWASQFPNSINQEADLTRLNFDTTIKLSNLNLANGTYFIGQLQNKGNKEETSTTTENVVLSTIENNCLRTRTSSGLVTVTRLNRRSCTTGNAISLFDADQEGSLEYKTASLRLSNNVTVGFRVNNKLYGFRTTVRTAGIRRVVVLSYSDGTTFKTITNLRINSPAQNLKVEKTLNADGTSFNVEFFRNGTSVAKLTIPNRATASSYVDIGSVDGQITDFKATKKVTKKVTNEITNQVDIVLVKGTTGIRPKVVVNQYVKTISVTPPTATSRRYEVALPVANALSVAQITNGIALNLNTTFGAGTVFSVNGNNQYLEEKLWSPPTTINPASIPSNTLNLLGGAGTAQPLAFDMCYFDYGINGVQNAFSFDDVTSQFITNNPPTSSQGITMNAEVMRTFGSCNVDTDGDGVDDVYEVNTDLTFIDTDNDGVANQDDKDDDGDGIYTLYEGANPDGDRNPATGATLNTNAIASVQNPKATINTIPNYLDNDDDGDGYATWETYEGGTGASNATTTGTPYTLNTDNPTDAIANYLDPTNGLYPPILPIVLKNYVNLAGDKRYELSNHLGNVLAVISDKKIPQFNTHDVPSSGLKVFNPEVLSYSDYYPFGMLVPNRYGSSDSYRYGFQGQEKDDELKGEGNSLNYTFRMHDPRVGRFFAPDPLEPKYPFFTPYQFNANSPIMSIELEGLEASNDPNQVQIPFTYNNENSKAEFGPQNSIFAMPIQLEEIVITAVRRSKVPSGSNFERYQEQVFKHEGGYVNDPADPGGATNRGIIFRNFKKWAKSDLGVEPTLGNLQNLSIEQASILYKKHFWDTFRGDEFDNGSTAFAIYDWSVTSGGAIKQIEKNVSKTLFSGITVDGKLSSNEVAALNKINAKDLFDLVNQSRLDYYDVLIEKSKSKYKKKHPNASEKALRANTLLKFRKGWRKRVNGIKFEE